MREFARGKGIGKALLQRIAKSTLEMGGGRLEWSVLDWNQPAISFYKKMGAVALDEWTTFRLTGEKLKKMTALICTLPLDSSQHRELGWVGSQRRQHRAHTNAATSQKKQNSGHRDSTN